MRHIEITRISTARRYQKGLSIVEVMVALTLGLVALGGATAIYLANRTSFATVESLARLEENARFAVDLLSRSIREAGNSVCGGAMARTYLVGNWANWDRGLVGDVLSSGAVAGKIDGSTGTGPQVANTDSLLIWSGSLGGPPVQITAYNTATEEITTNVDHNFVFRALPSKPDMIVACDGLQIVTGEVRTTAAANTLTINAGSPDLNAGGYLNKLSAQIWYVGTSNTVNGANSLRRRTIDKDGTTAANDEMVVGVSDLKIAYLAADSVGAPAPAGYASAGAIADWSAVTAVRLNLTLNNSATAGGAASLVTREVPMTVNLKSRTP